MDSKDIRKANLKLLVSRYDRAEDFAEAVETSASYLSQIFSEKTKANVGDNLARKIEARLALPAGWMDTLQGGNQQGYDIGQIEGWDEKTPLDGEDVEVPLYKEVEMAAGSGNTHAVEINGRKLRFARSTLRAAGVSPENAACATVTGNSMERLIMDGATIGIDRGRTQVKDGKIYAIDHGGMLRVKYLYRAPGGGLRLHSENEIEHPDETYTAEQVARGIKILGWVFWWSQIATW